MPAGCYPAGIIMKDTSIFNPDFQNEQVSSKIVAGLERISEVFKVLLWQKAKSIGLSPIQIQILIFVAYHKPALCNVSHLSQEFNVTKPTVSDAVKVLEKKGLIHKISSPSDNRSYTIGLTVAGKQVVEDTQDFAQPLKNELKDHTHADLEGLFQSLSKLIYRLNRSGLLTVQRTCYGCKFYEKTPDAHYCHLLEKSLFDQDIRLDCPEFEAGA